MMGWLENSTECAWRKVSAVKSVATFAAVLICFVVAAAMAAPPVAAALVAAASIPLGSMGRWILRVELKNFKDAGDPFMEEFFKILESVNRQHMQMLERLQTRKNKLDKKLKSIHAWRKVSTVIFAATFAAVLICSVVAAAMAAPPVAAALAAASSIPLGSMGRWINSLLENYENAVRWIDGEMDRLLVA